MSDLREIFNARLQLFDYTLPGDKRIAQKIHESGVVATRDRLATHTPLRDAEEIHQEILGASARFITPEKYRRLHHLARRWCRARGIIGDYRIDVISIDDLVLPTMRHLRRVIL
jgi:hypothetical protein